MSFDFRLIEEVKVRPFLYDSRDIQYKKVNLKENAWSEISEKLGKSGSICRKRWKNLRDHFRKLERKLSSQSLQSTAEYHDIKWAYYDALLFLKYVPTTKNLVDDQVFPKNNNIRMTVPPCSIDEVLPNKEENVSDQKKELPATLGSSTLSNQYVVQPAKTRKRKSNNKFSLLKDARDFVKATKGMESPREKLYKGFAAKIDNFCMPELVKEELDASINNLIFEKFKEYLTAGS